MKWKNWVLTTKYHQRSSMSFQETLLVPVWVWVCELCIEKYTALRIHLYKHDSFEQLLKWRTTKTNGCHPAVSLWRWGGKMKKKSNAVSRGLFEIVGEYFASSSLPGCGWQQEHMIYSSYFVAACNSSVGVFVCCSDVMLPSSAPCKVNSCYILPFVEGMQMWSAKTLIAAF